MAFRCADLADTQFLLGSKNFYLYFLKFSDFMGILRGFYSDFTWILLTCNMYTFFFQVSWYVCQRSLLQISLSFFMRFWLQICVTFHVRKALGRFIYILDSSNSSSFTFGSSKLASSSRSNWTGIWTGNSNGSWTDKHSSHFSTAKEMSVKATFFFM